MAKFYMALSPGLGGDVLRRVVVLAMGVALGLLGAGGQGGWAQGGCGEAPVELAVFAKRGVEGARAAAEVVTHDPRNTVGLALDSAVFRRWRETKPAAVSLPLPVVLPGAAGNGRPWVLPLERFMAFRPDIEMGTTRDGRTTVTPYIPQLITYRVVHPEVRGTLVVQSDGVIGTLRIRRGLGGREVPNR